MWPSSCKGFVPGASRSRNGVSAPRLQGYFTFERSSLSLSRSEAMRAFLFCSLAISVHSSSLLRAPMYRVACEAKRAGRSA